MIRRALAGTAILISLAGCSPAQQEKWLAWLDDDPQAAIEWVVNDCGALCTEDTNHNGIVEPDAGPPPEVPDPEVPHDEDFGDTDGGSVWDSLAQCESGGNWSISTGNGYYGGLQFSLSTWQAVGGSGYPHENSREEQIYRAEILLDSQGWGAWPSCSSQLGLR